MLYSIWQTTRKLIERWKKLGANRLIFALDPKLEMDTETLILHSGQKFMCFVVHFYEKFWFWYQTGIVPKKVYAVIWPLLEISSLNVFHKGVLRKKPCCIKFDVIRNLCLCNPDLKKPKIFRQGWNTQFWGFSRNPWKISKNTGNLRILWKSLLILKNIKVQGVEDSSVEDLDQILSIMDV